MYCPECGKQLEEGLDRCAFCDAELKKPSAESPTINIINTNTNANTNTNIGAAPGYVHKKKTVALLLAIFFGLLGIHRFYVGKIGTGILWALTGGLFFIGWIADIIFILTGSFRDAARMPLV